MTHLAECERDSKKSLQLKHGVIGRRLSPPALRLLNKSWTWSAVLTKLQSLLPDQFVRHKDPEIDKDKIKSEMGAGTLKEYGLKLEQDESFYAEIQRPPQTGGDCGGLAEAL
jgi:hypothetical protein